MFPSVTCNSVGPLSRSELVIIGKFELHQKECKSGQGTQYIGQMESQTNAKLKVGNNLRLCMAKAHGYNISQGTHPQYFVGLTMRQALK